MGRIETLMITIECKKCGALETKDVAEIGCYYNSSWESLEKFDRFNATIEQQIGKQPVVSRAICKKCGSQSEINETYR